MYLKQLKTLGLALLAVMSTQSMQAEVMGAAQKKKNVQSTSMVQPITGTWINLAYKDVRNKYTNPQNFDNNDPQLWAAKVREMSAMGIEYLVFMEVANEGKAYYPSKIMPWLYDKSKQSPVDAILDEAAKHGMKVFMSTGWAKDQDDNLLDPAIKERQLQIMEELASIYKNHKAFYGWYLPVEDCLCPIFAEHAVQSVNTLTEKAHKLTPGKKTLISPYGIGLSDFDNPEYEKQMAKLKVDIIAYQDEVGCVREQFPMKNMKEHFRQVSEIHKKAGIEFWANIETFTWDREANNWYSTLVPAAFGRVLSQLVGVNQAGVDKVVSFIVYSLFDKPGSPYPAGQRIYANDLYNDYMAWMNGDPRWKMLEEIFSGKDFGTHKVTAGPQALSDGKFGWEDPNDEAWCEFEGGKMECVIDLGSKKDISKVGAHFCDYYREGVIIPQCIEVEVSNDGRHFTKVKTVTYENWPNKYLDCWTDVILADELNARGRYVKVTAISARGRILCSEVVVE